MLLGCIFDCFKFKSGWSAILGKTIKPHFFQTTSLKHNFAKPLFSLNSSTPLQENKKN